MAQCMATIKQGDAHKNRPGSVQVSYTPEQADAAGGIGDTDIVNKVGIGLAGIGDARNPFKPRPGVDHHPDAVGDADYAEYFQKEDESLVQNFSA